MVKVGEKIRIIDPYSVFYGEILTVESIEGERFVSTSPKHPHGRSISNCNQRGIYWEFADE